MYCTVSFSLLLNARVPIKTPMSIWHCRDDLLERDPNSCRWLVVQLLMVGNLPARRLLAVHLD